MSERPTRSSPNGATPTGMKPATDSNERPYRFNQPERPCPLKEPINRTEAASRREPQDEQCASLFQRIADQHRGDGEQTKGGKAVHYQAALRGCCSGSPAMNKAHAQMAFA